MPRLDMSRALRDSRTTDRFIVWRRRETVDVEGISELNSVRYWPIFGVVTSGGDQSLSREPDGQTASRTLSIVTQFSVRPESPGYQPDVIEWSGSRYVVVAADPYHLYGPGFLQLTVESMTYVDPAPETLDRV